MRIGLCQIVSTPEPSTNLGLVREGVASAAKRGATVVVFPEATMACFGVPLGPLAEPVDGPWADEVREIAAEAGVTVVAGMFTPEPDGRVRNTVLVTGGGAETHYDKVHLYDAFGFAESRTVAPGSQLVTFPIGDIHVGLATCYDIRFPGLFTTLAANGASVILLGASWGAGPGKREQWELLVRARALDSTSWVVACGQADPTTVGREPLGNAPSGIGFSTVADPFGRIHAQLEAKPDVLVVDLDPATVHEARTTLPVLANRRF
ncbi:apolipoprotein acyltransferase [Longimycelium tulufanense]|uniref:Apolipoprotein acyltransferase n=1 Tax=Longimycelium tulufanense TaxID=907463 RepID=A0A8J3C653_9PSEU|nr:carbon-nitrogen hydrolase family protein [Longimycelium tulufanense]GGM37583.1 apolipoprotein acyltransferase [Longimycelium tulufanense]